MEIIMFQSFFCALFGGFVLAVLVKAQDQSGFISIDCEVLTTSNDMTSDLNCISDAIIFKTRLSKSIANQFCGVRSSPEGMKNCYTLLPAEGKDMNTGPGTNQKMEELSAFFNVVQSEKQNLYHGYITGLTLVELMERLKNGSLSLSLGENPSLCSLDSSQENDKKSTISLTVTVLFVLSFALTILLRLKRSKKKVLVEKRNISSLKSKNRHFTYSEVLQITDNIKRVLGKDGFGTVYHGYLNDTQVAVKMLSSSSCQGYEEFQAVVDLLMRVHHKNLTELIGYCNDDTNKGLIYKCVTNGNLQEHLSDRNAVILCWEDRLRIALDVAQGLEYLHKGCKQPIVHADVKSANILLNDNLEAKLTGFGISSFLSMEGHIQESTDFIGTLGYLDPEYHVTNRLNEKTDVYSFGVVLLEIITGWPKVFANENENIHVRQWIIDRVETGDMENIADTSLKGNFGTSSAWKLVELALACTYHVSSKRPTMNEVVMELKECLAMELAWKQQEPGQW